VNIIVLTLEEIFKIFVKLSIFLQLNLGTISEKELVGKINENKTPKKFLSRMIKKNRNLVSLFKIFISKKISDIIVHSFYKEAKKVKYH
jgi:hypothetical protein